MTKEQEAAFVDFGGVFEEVTFLGGTPVVADTSTNSVSGQDVKAPGTGDGIFDIFGDAARTVGGVFDAGIGLFRDFVTTELQFEALQNLRRGDGNGGGVEPQPQDPAMVESGGGLSTTTVVAIGAGLAGLVLLAVALGGRRG